MFEQYDEYILYKQNIHKNHQKFSKLCLTYSKMSGSMSTSKNKRKKTSWTPVFILQCRSCRSEMKRVRKDQVNSIEKVSNPPSIWSDRNRVSCKKDPVHIEMRMVPEQVEEQRYRSNIEAVFHIEHMSQNRYRDPDYRVKKR